MNRLVLLRRARGFTLIELMVTMAIVAILAAVALPAYREQVARGKRADVQTVLVEDAAYMQRYYAANNTYAAADAASMPAAQSPRTGAANYSISIASQSATGFSLNATPTGSMADDKCGTFVYDNLGQKTLSNPGSGGTVANCWR